MVQVFTILDSSEMQDFYGIINKLGFTDTDFELHEVRYPSSSGPIYAITGDVTITRRSANLNRTYPAGHGSSWLALFYADLAGGNFGQP